MFGLGYGMGNRNPRLRALRYGALALLLIGSVVFRHSGTAYSALRFGYLAVIVAIFATSARRRSGGATLGGARWAGGGPINATGGPSTATAPPPPGTVGWLPDPTNPTAEHYWDGTSWTQHRRWDGAGWVEE